ncbi:hypothetical protein TCDM_06680 [Trypanosoma cruzi Dm28c]|uniref:Uncharacterized protein n=1 Tax=Trypanosoma cruzi Dm28c TaxID=1416333 RepID=V5BBK9_TRYCR|nr:hypothetical protein TCDM_06680 [Trypanosoma cruzi Dm28c]PBJ70567.1 hypothetical protein BCY84_18272 [Trypanosoma cruzi cruzi]
MSQAAYCVKFYDSSDDEHNLQVAQVEPVFEETQSLPEESPGTDNREQQQQSSWLRRAIGGTVTFVTSSLSPQLGAPAGGQLDIAKSSLSASTGSDDWRYRDHRRLPFHEESPSHSDSLVLSEDIAVDLCEVILQYRRTPNDVYKRIILAALEFGEVQINGDVLRAAAGNRELIEMLLRSGRVNVDDRDVQEVIQEEINSVLLADELQRGRIYSDRIGYLTLLCRVPSATLTKEQARQCRQGGFEFAKLLYENPHVLRNILPPSWILARILDLCFFLGMLITWLGLAAIVLNLVSVAWLASTWFGSSYSSFGYWTILCYVAGYVGSIVVVMISEEGRIRDYDDRLWDYPDNSLKVVPCIPIFEIALMYVTLRYELRRDKTKYLVIRHDLYNGFSNLLIINTFLFATPQLLLQYYLSTLYDPMTKKLAAYKLLLTVNYTLYGMSMSLFMCNVFFQYSCNSFGFAVMAVKQAIMLPINITTRVLIIAAIFYLECNIIGSVMSLTELDACSRGTIFFTSIAVALTVLETIGLVILITFELTRHIWAVCVPLILLPVILSIYGSVGIGRKDAEVCRLLALSTSINPPFVYVAFVFLCATFFAWSGFAIYGKLTGKHLYLRLDSHFYWSWRR